MTKKDYELIARAIKLHHPCLGEETDVTLLAKELVSKLQIDNPRFDRKRFLEACGIEG